MNDTLNKALQASATFNFQGDATAAKKVALLPGVYEGAENLVNAGYTVDQVAEEWDGKSAVPVRITGANRVRYADFVNTVNRIGIKVSRIIFQNKNDNQDIYDQEIEVARTAVGAMGAMDFIQLQDYVDVNAYDRTKITIDLSNQPLYLGPETYLAMTIPAGANFSMKLVFEA